MHDSEWSFVEEMLNIKEWKNDLINQEQWGATNWFTNQTTMSAVKS